LGTVNLDARIVDLFFGGVELKAILSPPVMHLFIQSLIPDVVAGIGAPF
jgi:hypothetical protein